LTLPFETVFDGGFRKAMPNVNAWFERISKLPEVVGRVGNVKAAAKAIKPTLPAKEKPAAQAKPQAAPKKAEDGEEAPAKKDADPLDELDKTHPSKLNLYDYKTFFVNHPDKKGEGVQFFFDNYVPGEYTVYHVVYEKYPGEGEVLYQTLNLMNGFLQRIDHFRKHVLAMHAVLGEEPNLNIEGVWLFRGQGVPQQMLDHPQFEYYKKKELDISNENDRTLIRDFWAAKPGDTVNGQKVQECKMHK
jgi:elongation factor 1-gamma